MSAWTTIAAETSIPAANTPIAGAFALPADQNVIEISGQGPVGGGTLYLLRKVVGPTGNYEYRPYAPDKPIVIPSGVNGWFSARYYVGQAGGSGESFAIYNPASLALTGVYARGQVY